MYPGSPEHCNAEGTISEYSRNIACRLGNRLVSKGMSNFYLKVTIETFSKLLFSGFKKFVTKSDLGS